MMASCHFLSGVGPSNVGPAATGVPSFTGDADSTLRQANEPTVKMPGWHAPVQALFLGTPNVADAYVSFLQVENKILEALGSLSFGSISACGP